MKLNEWYFEFYARHKYIFDKKVKEIQFWSWGLVFQLLLTFVLELEKTYWGHGMSLKIALLRDFEVKLSRIIFPVCLE